MTLDQFQGIARILGNTTWVRTYLSSLPGKLVIEVANLDGSDLGPLRHDMSSAGFQEMPQPSVRRHASIVRFAIARTDADAPCNKRRDQPRGCRECAWGKEDLLKQAGLLRAQAEKALADADRLQAQIDGGPHAA